MVLLSREGQDSGAGHVRHKAGRSPGATCPESRESEELGRPRLGWP